MENNFVTAFVNAIMLVGAGLAYILPLRKRENWMYWIPGIFVLCLLLMDLGYRSDGIVVVVYHVLLYLVLVLMVNRCANLSAAAEFYCAIWIFITAEVVYEVWRVFQDPSWDIRTMDLKSGLDLLIFSAVAYLITYKTIAQWMPLGDIYQIGPRQLISALLLGSIVIVLSYYYMLLYNRPTELTVIIAMSQIYCVSLLYLQTELFKKAQMRKDLDVMNFLYSREQQQYAAARQNVSAVNRKCEELEQIIEQMQQYLPEELRREAKNSITDAMRACDTVVKSGNDVLDIVMTEKKILAEAGNIQINCVADGKLLDFMEVVDIYTLFSNALDNAIEAVEGLSDEHHRLIDVVVHESQNFLVINISNPLEQTLEFEDDLPITTKARSSFRGYGLKVLRTAVEKYRGMIYIEATDGFFTLKVLIPLSQK